MGHHATPRKTIGFAVKNEKSRLHYQPDTVISFD
jgi:hypothetical protein